MEIEKKSHYKSILNDLREKLTDGVERHMIASKEEVTGGVPDINDDATRTYNRQVILNLSEQERGQLEKIDEALQKIEDGQYGNCEECGENIPIKRLDIVPFAKFCVECKNKIEENSKDSNH